MIFGSHHVMTFDGKLYDIPKFPKSTCTYLLARDFVSGKFTILSQKENLIVQTPDIEVIIHQNGRVTSSVKVNRGGYTFKKEIRDLPVQSEGGSCVLKKNVVHCDFKQGLKVRCHNDRFMCTISLSSWYYGKTQGNSILSFIGYSLIESSLTQKLGLIFICDPDQMQKHLWRVMPISAPTSRTRFISRSIIM